MEISQNTAASVASPKSSALAETTNQRKALSSDFETFLKMLTTQMQNQNPLNPIESADFAVQLATFSGVEQQVKTNDLLTSLGLQMGVLGLSQLAGWVGMEARVSGPVQFDGAPITLVSDVQGNTVAKTLVVRNESGAEVQRLPLVAGSGPIEWAGVGPNGAPVPAGLYSFEVETDTGEGLVQTWPVDVFARIVEARILDGTTMVVLSGGQEVPASQISALRAPPG